MCIDYKIKQKENENENNIKVDNRLYEMRSLRVFFSKSNV